jgi:hippurate hydrolase
LFTRFPKPDFALGMHDDASLPAGVVGFHSGYFRAAVDQSRHDRVRPRRPRRVSAEHDRSGRYGSAHRPCVADDRIAREQPGRPGVITVGSIHGGSAWNIIPDTVKLQLTVRSLDPKVQQRLLSAIERQANGEAQAANAPEATADRNQVEHRHRVQRSRADAARGRCNARRSGCGQGRRDARADGSEDFSQFGIAGVAAVLLHVGAVDAAKLEESHKTGVPVPACTRRCGRRCANRDQGSDRRGERRY